MMNKRYGLIGLVLTSMNLWVSAQQAPVAVDDLIRVEAGSTVVLNYLHQNDTDADGDALSMVPTEGITYTPPVGFTGKKTISYTVADASGRQATGNATIIVNEAIDPEAARNQLLAGVSTIASGTSPGTLTVYGPTAYALNYYQGEGEQEPMIGFASCGSGRVLAMPDHQMLSLPSVASQGNTGRFIRNGVEWLSRSTSKDIHIITLSNATRDWLIGQGYTNVETSTKSKLNSNLPGADLFFSGWYGASISNAELTAITDFVRSGGGLFLCDYGVGYSWWWGKPLYNAPGNQLLKEAGIGFALPNFGFTGTIQANLRSSSPMNLEIALEIADESSGVSSTQKAQAANLFKRLTDALPPQDISIARRNAALEQKLATVRATPSTPVKDLFDQAVIAYESDLLKNTPVDEITAHHTAAALFGTTPDTAERITTTIQLDTGYTRWRPLGLYAPPGEIVTITLPDALVNRGYSIKVNAHRDNITKRDTWLRMPVVHRSYPINARTVKVANAFGGSLFIDLGGTAYSTPLNRGMLNIEVSGAIRQPWFDLDRHTDADWNQTLRNHPAPYAVLACSNLICVLPKTHIERVNLTEPERLMNWWAEVMRLQGDLAQRPTPRTGPEMINVDVQTSAGAAHAGYPIQAFLKYWDNLANVEKLTGSGSWGNFHELGHNHQRGWWTFPTDTEVSVNFFSVYCMRNLTTSPATWEWTADPVEIITKAKQDSNLGRYSSMANQARLSFWIQIMDGFGWDAFKNVIAGYEQDNLNNRSALPGSSLQDEASQWLTRFSSEVGYKLTPYMQTFGLPLKQSAINQVDHLPGWMPLILDHSQTQTQILVNQAVTIAPTNAVHALDNIVRITGFGTPANGRLIDNQDGSYTYQPDYNFSGTETLRFTLQSSAENTIELPFEIRITDGKVLKETWTGITGTGTGALTSSPAYPNHPSIIDLIDDLLVAPNPNKNYGTRLRTLLRPPVSGNYTFWIASNNSSKLFLGSNDTAASKSRIAYLNSYAAFQEWTKEPTQQSQPIYLEAGNAYYLEVLHKANTSGDDHVAVAWQKPGETQITVISAADLARPEGLYEEVESIRTWAGRHGLAGNDLASDADPDNDGYSNEEEFLAHTNPNDIDDVLRLNIDRRRLHWNAYNGQPYRIEYRNGFDDPDDWRPLSEGTTTNQEAFVEDPETNQPIRIYRLIIHP